MLSILIEKAYIVAVIGGGYMMPLSDTIYKSYTGAKKKLDSLKVKNETSSDYVILVADNWHVE